MSNAIVMTAFALTFSAWTAGAQAQAPVPQKKGQSAEKKGTTPAPGIWNYKKTDASSRKKPDAATTGATKGPGADSSTNTRGRHGVDSQGTEAQGVARDSVGGS